MRIRICSATFDRRLPRPAARGWSSVAGVFIDSTRRKLCDGRVIALVEQGAGERVGRDSVVAREFAGEPGCGSSRPGVESDRPSRSARLKAF